MPQRAKGARLYPYRRKGRETVYVIRDGTFQVSTGCGLGELGKAEEALARYLANRRPDTSERDPDNVAVADVLNLYQMDLPANKPSRELVGYHVGNLMTFWGDKSLGHVRGSACRKYAEKRVHDGVKESTARRELKTLSAAINHWHKESPLTAVPKVDLPPEGERRERVLERSEVARMLWACRKRKWTYLARFIIIGIYTGTRHAAILKLRWDRSLSGGYVDIERGILYRRGDAEDETSKRRPAMRTSKRLLAHLARWRDQSLHNVFRHIVSTPTGPIRSVRKSWRTICTDAGLGMDVTPHVMRHTFVTWALWAGVDLWKVAEDAGADATTIQKVYGHHRLAKEDKRQRA